MPGFPVNVGNPVRVNADQEKRILSALQNILQKIPIVQQPNGPDGSPEKPIHISLDSEALTNALLEVATALTAITRPPLDQFSFSQGGFVRVYKGDRPDEIVKFIKPQVVDSEGTPVDPQPELNYTFTSSDESGVTVSGSDNGDGTVDVAVHYGAPKKLEDNSFAIYEVKAQSNEIDTPSGPISDVKTEQIQLLPGDAAGFAGGGLAFPEI